MRKIGVGGKDGQHFFVFFFSLFDNVIFYFYLGAGRSGWMRIRPRDVLLLAITRSPLGADIDGPAAGRQSQKGLAPPLILRVSCFIIFDRILLNLIKLL